MSKENTRRESRGEIGKKRLVLLCRRCKGRGALASGVGGKTAQSQEEHARAWGHMLSRIKPLAGMEETQEDEREGRLE